MVNANANSIVECSVCGCRGGQPNDLHGSRGRYMHRGITGTSSTQLYVGRNRRVHAAKTRVSAAGERTKQEKERKKNNHRPVPRKRRVVQSAERDLARVQSVYSMFDVLAGEVKLNLFHKHDHFMPCRGDCWTGSTCKKMKFVHVIYSEINRA